MQRHFHVLKGRGAIGDPFLNKSHKLHVALKCCIMEGCSVALKGAACS